MLTRFDLYREMNQLRRAMDGVFVEPMERRWTDMDQAYSALALDMLENEAACRVKTLSCVFLTTDSHRCTQITPLDEILESVWIFCQKMEILLQSHAPDVQGW